MSEKQILRVAQAHIRQDVAEFERYLAKERSLVEMRCQDGKNLWLVNMHGPTYALGDSVVYLVNDSDSEIISHPKPRCAAARMRLTADQAIAVVRSYAASISWDLNQYGEPYARAECEGSDAPRWFVSATSKRLLPDSELLVLVDDRTGEVDVISQG